MIPRDARVVHGNRQKSPKVVIPAKAGIHTAPPYAASFQVLRLVILRTPNGFPPRLRGD